MSLSSLLGVSLWCLLTMNPNCGDAPPAAVRYIVFVDISRSVTQRNIESWSETAERMILPNLSCGDQLVAFRISGNTAEEAPFVEIDLPPLPSDPLRSEVHDCRGKLAKGKKRFSENMRALAGGPRSGTTDVLGLFESIDPVQHHERHTVVYVFSDLLNTQNADFNLSKIALRDDEQVAGKVRQVLAAYKWNSAQVAGYTFHMFLDPHQPGKASSSLNSHKVLKQFYSRLINEMGGELATFKAR